jgi:murein L,D-transpeptidase YcbB/YkuD
MESEYGVFVSNAREDVNKMQQVKQLSQAMLQNDVPLSDVLETIDADSVQTMKEKIKEAEKSRQKLAEAQRQADMQQQLQEQELEYAKIKADLEEARMDNETKIQLEQMKQGQDAQENARERILKEEELDVERRNIESDERIARAQMQQNNSDE